jgi:hypothetical protein
MMKESRVAILILQKLKSLRTWLPDFKIYHEATLRQCDMEQE